MRTTHPVARRGRRVLLAGMTAAVLVLAGCSEDTAPETTAPDDPPLGADATGTDAAAGETVVVTATDYGYEGLPATVAPGTRLSLVNTSDAELHEIVAIRLPDTETRSASELLQLPEAELGPLFAGLTDVVVALPGTTDVPGPAEGDAVLDEPGRYLLFCGIPTGADPQAYLDAAREAGGAPRDFPGGPPHFTLGMFAEVTVG